MKLLENFAIPIPSEESEIKALYEGIKGLGYKMYNSTYRCYLNSEYIYLCRDVNYVSGGNKNSTYLYRVYPTFEAFKEAHEALNREAIPEKRSYTKGFPYLEEFLEEYGLSFEDFMEGLYSQLRMDKGEYWHITNNCYLSYCDKEDHDQQGDNYTFTGIIVDGSVGECWEFEIRDGNCSGTEVINFEKTVDKEISKEDNTMARVNSKYIEMQYDATLLEKHFKENPNLNKTEEKTMRRVVTVKLINPNTAIEADMSLVGNFGEYVTDDSNDVLIQEIIMEGDVQDLLDLHNNYLTETVDQSILKATGQEVMLRPVRLKDLKWIIKE